MSFHFNPMNGLFEKITIVKAPSDIIKSILLASTPEVEFSKAEILFDIDSILYNDDEALE